MGRAAVLARHRNNRRPARRMLPAMIQHHPHRSIADFRRKLVRCLAHRAPSYSGVGASGKPGAVQPVFGQGDTHVAIISPTSGYWRPWAGSDWRRRRAETASLDREAMTQLGAHQFAQPGAMAGVAGALRRPADLQRLDACLAVMPGGGQILLRGAGYQNDQYRAVRKGVAGQRDASLPANTMSAKFLTRSPRHLTAQSQ